VSGVRKRYWLGLGMIVLPGLIGLGIVLSAQLGSRSDIVHADPAGVLRGVVVDATGPVAGATVRIQATADFTHTGLDGTFVLGNLAEGVPVTVSAWADGYYCAKVEGVAPPAEGLTLTLRRYQTNDNPAYVWIPPTGPNSCASCKPRVTQIWLDNDAHARAGINPRFLSLYNGANLTGTLHLGGGYKDDFPGTVGNCANCHAPGAAVDAPFTTDMNRLSGVNRDFGVHCDFCHKVAAVRLNRATGLPYANMPGVLSMDVRRPFPESERYQLFFGTFDDDNVPQEDTYLPLIQKSQYCATCHQFSFWGTPIYQSFREWLESPYPSMGIECQTCHMPSDGVTTNVAPGTGGVERNPRTIHAHTMPGASSVELLQNTVSMTVAAEHALSTVQVSVTLTNARAGHHVPTDHPGRHMLLVIRATDEHGRVLIQQTGSVVPDWGGAQAGLPGKAFAKVLQDVATGEAPVVNYWKRTRIVSDNRIPAMGGDTSTYTFAAPVSGGAITITAELRFRRVFQTVIDSRGWTSPDIVMNQAQARLTAKPWWPFFLPLVIR
jgi:hypothetical protein